MQQTVKVSVSFGTDAPIKMGEIVEHFEKQMITGALTAGLGIKAEAARMLGLNRSTLVEKMRRYGMQLAAPTRSKP